MMNSNFDCKLGHTLPILQILFKTMHVLDLQDSINHYCNLKLFLQGEINIVNCVNM